MPIPIGRYGTSYIGQMSPDLTVIPTGPTRNDATLDYTFSNFTSLVESAETCFPIESSTNKSDHMSILYEAILTRPATFAWDCLLYTSPSPRD